MFSIDIRMALGLFAIFGIIRYRTQTVEIKEMTYLFVVIGVSVINALSNADISYSEILGVNAIIVVTIFVIEHFMVATHGIKERLVVYNDLENIKPENHSKLMTDLKEKTGLSVKNIKVNKVDYLNKVATLTLYYIDNGDQS